MISSFLYLLGSSARMKAIMKEQYTRSFHVKYFDHLCTGDLSSLVKRK